MELNLRRKQQLRITLWTRTVAFLGLIAFLFLILLTVENMLLSFVLALVLNYLLSPIVSYFERAGIHRLVSTLVVFVVGGVLMGIAITSIIPFLSEQLSLLNSQMPKYVEGVSNLVVKIEQQIQSTTGLTYQTGFEVEVESLLLEWTKQLFGDLPALVSKTGTTIILAPFFAFFLIKDGRAFAKNFLNAVPNNIFELTLNMYYQINEQMGQFVRARILEAIIVGFVVLSGLWIIDFPFATLLALFAGLTNLIPYLGPFIGGIPAVIIALINGDSAFAILVVCSIYGIAQLIDVFFIIPLVVAKLVNLHPITVVVAIIVGAQLLGILGMIISIPVASALKVTFTSVYSHLVDFRA